MYLIFNKIAREIIREGIGKAIVNKVQIQIHHQWSLVTGLLAPHESIFCQMDVTLYVLVPAVLLLSFPPQPYQHFP